ncbi:DUF1127 domain-containing protein [Pseudomonas caspiana]|uniref:DUF1127 domain-containing protein n=1 Tax=Pseudomonas caspiana TaxID=1451454 RepID=UPI0032EB1B82
MNGLSDVRLALYSQDLGNGRAVVTKTANAPKLGRWALYRHRWISRRTLLTLTEDQLRDVGLSSGQALLEGLKPFWRE